MTRRTSAPCRVASPTGIVASQRVLMTGFMTAVPPITLSRRELRLVDGRACEPNLQRLTAVPRRFGSPVLQLPWRDFPTSN
jgi:hypothetical protein